MDAHSIVTLIVNFRNEKEVQDKTNTSGESYPPFYIYYIYFLLGKMIDRGNITGYKGHSLGITSKTTS